ncbi:hypothetical protein VNO77_49224 [Canavalia gladiata]|uniref:Uncharacterized protein n=1 Tax=Canavalia gladiata TaxID=3824 RepID=A0AAN9JFV9_CANGL
MTTSTSFSPINYLIDLDTEYEAMKKAFYQSVAATKAMNAGRINGALNEIEIDNFSKNSVKPVVKQKPSYKDNENLFWSKGKGGTYHATSPTNPKNWRVGITYGVNYRQARSAQQIAEQSKARLIGLHWTTHIVDFEIRLKLMPPKLSNENHIHEQLEEFLQNFDFAEKL